MTGESTVLIFGVLVCIGFMLALEAPKELIVLIKEITPCTPGLVEPWELNVTMRKDPFTSQTTISGEFTLRAPYTDKYHIHVEIRKCMSQEESSCYRFIILDDTSYCKDLRNTHKWWYKMQSHIRNISFTCPIPVGTYKVEEMPISKVISEYAAVMPGIWRMKSYVKEGERIVGCVLGYGEIKPVRRPRKKPSNGPVQL